jgi:phosphoribosylformimino-5-aminoimidazole carboxamide ribotide isomerase
MPEPMFEVIPAIDLRGGAVVHARKGLRQSYTPLKTPLAPTSAPRDVVLGLLTIHPFQTIYIADLDRIEMCGSQERCLEELSTAFPAVAFWVDAGIRHAAEAHAWLACHKKAHLVLGSETLENASVLEDLASAARTLLSLDYLGDDLLGPREIWDKPRLWPARVIVMTLARVGTQAGPEFDRLAKVKRRVPKAGIYAAGGVRDGSDLMRLKAEGASGVLVSSALHDGDLTGAVLAAFKQERAVQAK